MERRWWGKSRNQPSHQSLPQREKVSPPTPLRLERGVKCEIPLLVGWRILSWQVACPVACMQGIRTIRVIRSPVHYIVCVFLYFLSSTIQRIRLCQNRVTPILIQPYYFFLLPFCFLQFYPFTFYLYFIAFPFSSFLDSEATFTSKSAVVLLSSTNFFPSHFLINASPEEIG